jgi:hypothetical protein
LGAPVLHPVQMICIKQREWAVMHVRVVVMHWQLLALLVRKSVAASWDTPEVHAFTVQEPAAKVGCWMSGNYQSIYDL